MNKLMSTVYVGKIIIYSAYGTYFITASQFLTDVSNLTIIWLLFTVILLQIVMMSPGTHLVKNHESQSRTNEFQLTEQKGVMLGHLCKQTVNLETDTKWNFWRLSRYELACRKLNSSAAREQQTVGLGLFNVVASWVMACEYLSLGLLIVLWCSAKTRKINLMGYYVLCLLRSEAEINLFITVYWN